MILRHTPRRLLLIAVDSIILLGSLWVAVFLRNWGDFDQNQYSTLLPSFLLIIIASLAIFYIYGLYDKPSLRLIRELRTRIISSQILAGSMAVIFFYSLPTLGVAPKTILFIYIAVASVAMIIWRYYASLFVLRYRKQTSVILGSGKSFHMLVDELSRNPHTGITLVSVIDLDEYDVSRIGNVFMTTDPDSIIADLRDPRIKQHFGELYSRMWEGSAVYDIINVYEDVFDMVPLDILNQEWIFRHINNARRMQFIKRALDVILAIPTAFIPIIIYPFLYIAIKLDDGGPFLYPHVRIGRFGKPFTLYKVRSMEHKETNELNETKQVTRVGSFIRKTRLDEFAQLWNVFKGDVSFIGPRPEAPNLVEEYSKTIPYYPMRHIVRPGLSGWAQVQQTGKDVPRFGVDINQTSTKLAYDIYYLEHEDIWLDIAIVLRTIKVLLSKSGV
jgi:lipopolysaccharide/colanic/teichoic acid biosynthesis glycosyltransferase